MAEFMSYIIWPLVTTIITGVIGYVGVKLKQVLENISVEKSKRQDAKTCVQAVEQFYKDLHGEDKYAKCVEALTKMLEQKGITVTELEMRMLIESAVQELNAALQEATAE